MSDRAGEAGARGAEGVAEGDGAALGVEDRRVELGPFGEAAEDLGGVGFVEFQDVEVGEGLAGLGQGAVDGLDWGKSEVVRVNCRCAAGAHAGERLATGGFQALLVDQQ